MKTTTDGELEIPDDDDAFPAPVKPGEYACVRKGPGFMAWRKQMLKEIHGKLQERKRAASRVEP